LTHLPNTESFRTEFDKSFLSSGSPPQITSYPPQYTTLFPCRKAAAHKRLLRQLSAPRLIQSNNYVPGGISCAADLTTIFRHKISVSGAPSGKRLLSASAHSPGRGRCFPRPLTAREEAAAFSALHAGDAAAREKLIRHNLRLVAHIVKKYYALPGDQEDLVSIGTIGLMKAVDTFDATRKARFSTYASRCIENAILSPAHFGMEKRIHLFHAMTHLRQNGFFGAERAVPFFCFRGCHVRVVV